MLKRKRLLELGKRGTDIDFVIPKNTKVTDIYQALAYFIIETSKYRTVKTSTTLAEIEQWVKQVEDNL